MIRRSPAEYYIKYLLLHPDNYDDDDIKRVLKEHQLDFPGGKYLDRLRARLRPPSPFYPLNDLHPSSFRYLVSEKVHTLFHQDRKTVAALEILNKPRVKEMVESMTLLREPYALVVVRLQRAGLGSYRAGDLQRYCHFFWNLDLVDSTELNGLMQIRANLTDGDDVLAVAATKAMVRASYNDPRYSAATSPIPVVAAMRLQVRYGYMPDRVTTARLATLVAALGTGAAAEAAHGRGPKGAQHSRDYMAAAVQAAQLRQLLGSPEESLEKELQQLAVATAEGNVPHIDELTDGDYTEGLSILTEGENVER